MPSLNNLGSYGLNKINNIGDYRILQSLNMLCSLTLPRVGSNKQFFSKHICLKSDFPLAELETGYLMQVIH